MLPQHNIVTLEPYVPLEQLLRTADIADLVERDRIVAPGVLMSHAGTLRLEDPAALQVPQMDAVHADDLADVPTIVQFGGNATRLEGHRLEQSLVGLNVIKLPPVTVKFLRVDRPARGVYIVRFAYKITAPDAVSMPIQFRVVAQGSAARHIGCFPWTHESGAAKQYVGYIPTIIGGAKSPIASDVSALIVIATDSTGKEVGAARVDYVARWYKRFRDITRDNLRDYFATSRTASSSLPIVGGSGPASIGWQQAFYKDEDAAIYFRTSEGNFAKALVRAERTPGTQSFHLLVVGAYTYARNQAAWRAMPERSHWHEDATGGRPSAADQVNEIYGAAWEGGGYIFGTDIFDLDWAGTNCSSSDGDIHLRVSNAGHAIETLNNARIAY